MKVSTYTNVFSIERKIYTFGDISLPTPISFKQMGLFMLVGAPWFFTLALLQIPFATMNPWLFMLWFGPPVGIAIMGSKKLLEGKSLFEFLGSQITFLLEPKNIYDGKADSTIGKSFTVESKFWTKNKEIS